MSQETRTESDSMGPMQVPAQAYYGAQTARAVENFPISNLRFPRVFIQALGLIKKHAAKTNGTLGYLSADQTRAITEAAQEVMEGRWDPEFVVDIFQTGSGTSTNMNANEVIANRAGELLGGRRGDKVIHPNDHVNRGQSSNDTIPTALHLAALLSLTQDLLPALQELLLALQAKAKSFNDIIKIGRTHLQDATPMRVGQEFGGYASQVEHGIQRLVRVQEELRELALGGTAVGTGLNTHPDFARMTIAGIAAETHLPLREATNHFEAQSARDACVAASGALKTVSISLMKIANDIRLLGSGPRLGLGELILPATQPGSSIMPGKVNPVMCEMVLQVGAQVLGNDAVIAAAATLGSTLELNVMMPVMTYNLLQSISLLAKASEVFARRCIQGLEVDRAKLENNLEQSLALATALVPALGYDRAAAIAKTAHQTGRTVREVALDQHVLDPAELDRLLDPVHQTHPAP